MDKGAFDLVQDLAYPLPVIVIAEMLGVDPDGGTTSSAGLTMSSTSWRPGRNEARMVQYMESWEAFKAYFVR